MKAGSQNQFSIEDLYAKYGIKPSQALSYTAQPQNPIRNTLGGLMTGQIRMQQPPLNTSGNVQQTQSKRYSGPIQLNSFNQFQNNSGQRDSLNYQKISPNPVKAVIEQVQSKLYTGSLMNQPTSNYSSQINRNSQQLGGTSQNRNNYDNSGNQRTTLTMPKSSNQVQAKPKRQSQNFKKQQPHKVPGILSKKKQKGFLKKSQGDSQSIRRSKIQLNNNEEKAQKIPQSKVSDKVSKHFPLSQFQRISMGMQNQERVDSQLIPRKSIDKYLRQSNDYSLENLLGQVEQRVSPQVVNDSFPNFPQDVNMKKKSKKKSQAPRVDQNDYYYENQNENYQDKVKQLERIQKLNQRQLKKQKNKTQKKSKKQTVLSNSSNRMERSTQQDRESEYMEDNSDPQQEPLYNPVSKFTKLSHKIYNKVIGNSDKRSRKTQFGDNPGVPEKVEEMVINSKEIHAKTRSRQFSQRGQQIQIQRLQRKGYAMQQSKALTTNAYQKQAMQDCTFKPKTNKRKNYRKRNFNTFLDDLRKFEERKKQNTLDLKKQLLEKEKNNSFKPKILNKSAKIVKRKQKAGGRNEPFYKRLHYNKRDQLQKQIQDMLQDDYTEQMSSISNSQQSRYSRQSQYRSVRKQDENSTFVPTINSRSKRLIRDKPVEEHLYNDALRRQKKKQMKQPKPEVKKVFSANSEQCFAHKFIREYEQIIQNIFVARKQKKLNYMVICEVMEKMGFIKTAQKLDSPNFIQERTLMFDMWLVLKGDQLGGVTKRNLLVFLFAIVGLNFQIAKEDIDRNNEFDQGLQPQKLFLSEKNQQVFQEYIDNIRSKTKIGYFDNDNDFFLKEQDSQNIYKVYDLFYLNRLMTAKRKQKSKIVKATQYSFKPKTNKRSNKLATKRRIQMLQETEEFMDEEMKAKLEERGNKLTHADLLVYHKRAQDRKLKLKQKKTRRDKIKQTCTFVPKTIDYVKEEGSKSVDQSIDNFDQELFNVKKPYSMPAKRLGKHRAFELYSLAKPRAQKKDRDPDELEYEKYCDECTFAPDLTSTKNRNVFTGPTHIYAKNVDKAVKRLRKGRLIKEQVAMWKEKGYTNMGVITLDQLQQIDTLQTEQEQQQIDSDENIDQERQEMEELRRSPSIPEENVDMDEGGEEMYEDNNQPLLFVDVNLGVGNQERIVVCEGDQADELAYKFAKQHNLDDEMRQRLQQLLENQMATLLTRIDERIDEETYPNSAQESDESPQKNRFGMEQQPPEPIQEEDEDEEEVSDEQVGYVNNEGNEGYQLNQRETVEEEDEEAYEEEEESGNTEVDQEIQEDEEGSQEGDQNEEDDDERYNQSDDEQ